MGLSLGILFNSAFPRSYGGNCRFSQTPLQIDVFSRSYAANGRISQSYATNWTMCVIFRELQWKLYFFSQSYGANSWFFVKLRAKLSFFFKLRCTPLFFVALRGELQGEVISTRGPQKTQKSFEIPKKVTHPRPGAPLEGPLETGFWTAHWSTGKTSLKTTIWPIFGTGKGGNTSGRF